MRWLVFILLMVGFATAVDIEFDCPYEIFANESFECSLEVYDGDGEYDVKVDLDGERNSVVQLWNDGEWKSGYYYLNDFIEDGDERNIRMRISEEGDWDWVLKLRQGDKREEFDIEIEVGASREVMGQNLDVGDLEEVVILFGDPEVVFLNADGVEGVDELVYVSKDARVKDFLPYGFSLFLIFVIGILLWERF